MTTAISYDNESARKSADIMSQEASDEIETQLRCERERESGRNRWWREEL